eukprot:m.13572 g.13572  ORF g.13572 m.13572 type:complete len:79 (+) comp6216_c0_seq1:6-242(+)
MPPSGLQKEVFGLYRAAFRAIRSKPEESQPAFKQYVRNQFAEHKSLKRTDVMRIEQLLRRGRKQLEVFSNPSCKSISL